MFEFAANLNFLFYEYEFMERFEAASRRGFKYVEFMFPYDFDQDEIKRQLKQHNLNLVLFNLSAGDWAAGDRGLAVDPTRKIDFVRSVEEAVKVAEIFNVSQVNCLVGLTPAGETPEVLWKNMVSNIALASDEFKKKNLKLLVESINHYDMPEFYLNTTEQVIKLIKELNRSNIYLQYDVYHADRENEDHTAILENYFDNINHIQIADNPGRNQPGTGNIDYRSLFTKLETLKYKGFVSMEYKPDPDTESSLEWINNFGYKL